jgi:hypothetical protein
MRPLYTLGFLVLSFFSFAQTPKIISYHVISGICNAVAYGNGVYVAGGSSGTLTSANAKTWTLLNSDSVPSFNYLAFGNGVFVGVAGSSIYSSSNGTNWTYRADAGGIASEINFTHGVFYVVNSNEITSGNQGIVESSDGVNWAALNLGIAIPTPVTFNGFDYNGSVYVIGVTVLATRYFPSGSSGVLYSATADSGSWTFDGISALPPVTNVQWAKNMFYLFAQDGLYTSADGINWALPSPPMVDTMLDGTVSTPGGSEVFTVGDSIYLIGSSSLEISTDGMHFRSYNPPSLNSIAGGLYANGLVITYGSGGLATASDGVDFTLNGTLFSALATNGSSFVAAGYAGAGGPLFTSPDFVTWTQQPPVAASMIVYNGSNYLAEGAGNAWFSPNGGTWSSTPVGATLTAMDYGAGRYVAGAFYDLISSTDGINWSEVDSSYSFYYKIRYLNNNFFALGMNFQNSTGLILQSTDGVHWTNITPQTDSAVTFYNDVMYDGTKYYFTGLKNWTNLFTLSTTDPTNTTSYGAMGGIVNPAAGTTAVEYSPQFDDFLYHSGLYVGTTINNVNNLAYLTYSTDGINWTTTPLGGSGHGQMIVSDSGIYHVVTEDGGYYTVSFAGAAVAPPVLLRFEAEAVRSYGGEDSRLRWEVKNDSSIAYYLVQHSLDTVRWDSIGEVTPEKRERATERYQFIQDGPPAGANYYRIGLIDRDGSRSWSPIRRVDIRKEDIRVYPNPARDVLHVQLPGEGPARLTVFNNGWMPVRRVDARGDNVTIDLWSLRPGVYYLQVFQDGKWYSAEFMIAE